MNGSKNAGHDPAAYGDDGPKDCLRMLAETKPDAVIIATDWNSHAEVAVASMKAAAHAFVEAPIALTLKEIRDIADTSEAAHRHCR